MRAKAPTLADNAAVSGCTVMLEVAPLPVVIVGFDHELPEVAMSAPAELVRVISVLVKAPVTPNPVRAGPSPRMMTVWEVVPSITKPPIRTFAFVPTKALAERLTSRFVGAPLSAS